MKLHALVFDFDGLICDTEGAQMAAGRELFAEHGAELPLDRWTEVIGLASPANFWVPWLEECVGRKIDEASVMADFSRRNRQRVAELAPNPGVTALLDAADDNGIAVAVASSSPVSWVEPLLEALGIRDRFATVVCREHAARAKPFPDLYLEAARRLAVDPKAAVAFEDSHHGSVAAVSAGMTCVAVPGPLTRAQDFSHVHAVVESLAGLVLDDLLALVGAPAR